MKRLLFVCCILSAINLSGGEFWLQPVKFIYKPGETVNIRFFSGENFTGENWNGNNLAISSLQLYFPDASDDLSDYISEEEGDSLQISLFEEGSYMLTCNSVNTPRILDESSFDDYLSEKGLLNASRARKERRLEDSVIKEYNQHSTKTLIQVGRRLTDVLMQPTGIPMDIIPLQNPYDGRVDSLTLRILLQQRRMSNTPVHVWHRINNKSVRWTCITNDSGECRIALQRKGEWMISCFYTTPISNEDAAWQSYLGSLTWGYTR